MSITYNGIMNKRALGLNIKAERNRKDWSQDLLAEKANLSKTSVSLIENGNQTPSAFALYAIAKALNISIDELFKGVDD